MGAVSAVAVLQAGKFPVIVDRVVIPVNPMMETPLLPVGL
jgi:hypothetical protein